MSTSHDDDGNTRVSIRVHHLAPPPEVVPSTTTYVAWISPVDSAQPATPPPTDQAQRADAPANTAPATPQATSDQPVNAGVIRVNGNLDGDLDVVTPRQQFQVSITAERDPLATRPTNPPVLTATVR